MLRVPMSLGECMESTWQVHGEYMAEWGVQKKPESEDAGFSGKSTEVDLQQLMPWLASAKVRLS